LADSSKYAHLAGDPKDFSGHHEQGKHAALFYEDSDSARELEFGFLQQGLSVGESGIYASTNDRPDDLSRAMSDFGIDVERHRSRGTLHIYKVPDPATDPQGPSHGLEEFVKVAKAETSGPYRQVGRLFGLASVQEVENSIAIEKMVQESVRAGGCSILCSFDVGTKGPEFDRWFSEMLKQHQTAIFGSSRGEGIEVSPSQRIGASGSTKHAEFASVLDRHRSLGALRQPASWTGKSGVPHSFAFSFDRGAGPEIVGEIVTGHVAIDAAEVLSMFIKIFDVNPMRGILCVSPQLTPEAERLAMYYGVLVIESPEAAKLPFMLGRLLDRLARTGKKNAP